jgi:hypothetical protein
MHDRGVCDFDALSHLLSHVSRKSRPDGFQRSGVVPAMVSDSVVHAHSFGGGDSAFGADHAEPRAQAAVRPAQSHCKMDLAFMDVCFGNGRRDLFAAVCSLEADAITTAHSLTSPGLAHIFRL